MVPAPGVRLLLKSGATHRQCGIQSSFETIPLERPPARSSPKRPSSQPRTVPNWQVLICALSNSMKAGTS